MSQETQSRGQWGSKLGFILAAAGSAVGLGNIWKFPYITGENGGGLFVLIYLFCIAIVGLPIMMAEIMIGRAAQKQPVVAFEKLQGKKTGWASVGWLGVFAGFIILSYYIVVAGWAMDFTLKSVANFTGPIHDEAEVIGVEFRTTASPDEMRGLLIEDEVRRTSRDPLTQIRKRVKPSTWDAYELYLAGLQAAGAGDPVQVEAEIEAWKDHAEQYQTIKGAALPESAEALRTDAFRQAHERLIEREDFGELVPRAQALLPEMASTERDHMLDALQKYQGMQGDELRDRAEETRRRSVIFDRVQAAFLSVATDGWTSTFWAALFMVIVILIVASGIGSGIERTCRILMPTLFGLILVMVVFGATKSGFAEAVSFVFKPDPHKLKASGILEALGHAFFTLSLGMGAMITYGSYQNTKEKLLGQSFTIALLDTGIALLACLMMFPIIFSYGQDPSAGPGLVFMSMPLAFAEIGSGGILLAILFFGLVVFAALTSAISLLEVVASYFIDQRGWTRMRAAWVLGGIIFLFGLPSAFAMDPDFVMSGWEESFGLNFFDTMDYLASNWMLPLGGLFIAIYAGWVMPRKFVALEMEGVGHAPVLGWLLLIRFVAPILVIIVLAQKVGLLDADEYFHWLFS